MRITIDQILEWKPCDPYRDRDYLYALMCGESFTSLEIAHFEKVPIKDRIWTLLHEEVIPGEKLYLLGCDFAEHVLHYSDDKRSINAIEARRKWVRGEITDRQLKIAAYGAYGAYSAAYAADSAYAAYAVAFDSDSAFDPAADAAFDAASYAADAADGVEEESSWQLDQIIKRLEN